MEVSGSRTNELSGLFAGPRGQGSDVGPAVQIVHSRIAATRLAWTTPRRPRLSGGRQLVGQALAVWAVPGELLRPVPDRQRAVRVAADLHPGLDVVRPAAVGASLSVPSRALVKGQMGGTPIVIFPPPTVPLSPDRGRRPTSTRRAEIDSVMILSIPDS